MVMPGGDKDHSCLHGHSGCHNDASWAGVPWELVRRGCSSHLAGGPLAGKRLLVALLVAVGGSKTRVRERKGSRDSRR